MCEHIIVKVYNVTLRLFGVLLKSFSLDGLKEAFKIYSERTLTPKRFC